MNLTIQKILAGFITFIIILVNLFGKIIGVGDIIPTQPEQPETTTTEPVSANEGETVFAMRGKQIVFGSDESDITNSFGQPDEKLSDELKSGSTIESYVYCSDYSRLTVIMALNGKISGVYTFDKTAVFADSENTMNVDSAETLISGLHVIRYNYKVDDGGNMAIFAKYGSFDYDVNEVKTVDVQEKLVFHATNGYRAAAGVDALKWSDKAATAARLHSEDMAKNDYIAHENLAGESSDKRMMDQGISSNIYAENLCSGFDNAFEACHGWFNSEGHRENMLHAKLRYLGTGIALSEDSTYGSYYTQNFYR